MKKNVIFLSAYLLFIVNDAFALRCGSKLVNEGDRKAEVLTKCGEPALVERWEEEIVIYGDDVGKHVKKVVSLHIEEWTYNFGSNKFLYFLEFRDGKLFQIEAGSRGYDGDIPLYVYSGKTGCSRIPSIGDRKIEVIMKCGKPTLKEEHINYVFGKEEIHKKRSLQVNTEEWTYNFGPNEFINFIKFENGRVIDVERSANRP